MNGWKMLTGVICLLGVGLMGADYLATTITTDGSVMLATSGSDENGSFASRTMALDSSQVSRTVSGSDELNTDLTVRGAGPVLLSEYASAILHQPGINELCVFFDHTQDQTTNDASMYLSGIIDPGGYELSRTIGSGLSGTSQVNGTGMILLGSQNSQNRTLESHGFVSGNLTVKDLVRYGGNL
ncbi:MAG: hypothetical protein LUQ50_13125 [Methanospirillum sp.]|uniref:hypothetical protein n=1 Tax=Methanospirillum sp. TaxID=45200 RepID=UPI00236EED6F|nr:hypothetical protein [Methanospirillum sp.]MDD1729998.1 hypothetical protein [Methanospirillum sp.]